MQFSVLDGLRADSIVGIGYMRDKRNSLDFFMRTLVVNNIENACKLESSSVSADLEYSGLTDVENDKFKEF